MAPISVRSEDDKNVAGNQISVMSVTLYSNEADPVERLRLVQQGTRASKATAEAVGARMVALHGMGPVMDGMGLIHPVFSCSGQISVAITACRQQMPDPGFYAECLQASFDELYQAVTQRGRAKGSTKAATSAPAG